MHYYRLSVLFALTAAHLAGLATPTPLAPPWDDMHVKHAWNAVQANWENLGPPPPGTTIDLHVALKPHDENALIDALYEVSTPGHQKYGAYLSKEEVAKLVAPHPDTFELVRSWLAHHGVQSSSSSTTHGGSWLTLTGIPVSIANKLLGASYQLYRYAGTNDTAILRTAGYALPTVLHAHVQTVAPTTFFASARTLRQQMPHRDSVGTEEILAKAAASRELPVRVTPPILRWMYTTLLYVPAATDQNALGIVGFGDESPSPTDLRAFMDVFRTEGQTGRGHSVPNPARLLQHRRQYGGIAARPTIPGRRVSRVVVPRACLHNSVRVASASSSRAATAASALVTAGSTTALEESSLSLCSLRLHCYGFAGPWITSVGGTTNSNPEVGASISGGGFSNYFLRPEYQKVAVPAFLRRLGVQYYGLYTPISRGIPDISAQALNYPVVVSAGSSVNVVQLSSTRCAVTTAASIISLLNDYLLSNGRPPLGFLNPLLYKDEVRVMGLNDITSGINPGCGTLGFSATVGWDPVTGLGTPSFNGLLNALDHVVGPGNQGRTWKS